MLTRPLYCCILILSLSFSALPHAEPILQPPPFHTYSAWPNLGMFAASLPSSWGYSTSHRHGLFFSFAVSFQESHLPNAVPITPPSRNCNAQSLISSFVFFSALIRIVQSQNIYLIYSYTFSWPSPHPYRVRSRKTRILV